MASITINLQSLLDFHSIDRKVYARLVHGLGLDFNLGQQVVAFWHWLERKGYKHFIKVMLHLPNQLLYGLAMEAKTCFDCLNIDQSIADCLDLNLVFPLMLSVVSENFSIVQLYKDRDRALIVMECFLKNVCGTVFNDIIPRNLVPNFGFQVPPVMANPFSGQPQPVLVDGFPVQSSSEASNIVQVPIVLANSVGVPAMMANPIQVQPLVHVPAFVPNGVQVLQDVVSNGAQVSPLVPPNGTQVIQVAPVLANGFQVNHNRRNLKSFPRKDENARKDENGTHAMPNGSQSLLSVSEHDRTLFVTFSKGRSSISKMELRDLIKRNFGYCVESIHMRVEPPPLFALVVLKSASALTKILGDKGLVKLSISGKDVWLRRFLIKQDQNHL